ncbi:unnamed protein product [Cylindrotheca closterium]|uniref:Flavodoxin-like domain-containing protein n=1 Tax=Cylindrotheca closterium TaxID=2856 RepID=A0AAD2CD18_9STRA|nr:unnamed protein product [Cylindrotheca closterium]
MKSVSLFLAAASFAYTSAFTLPSNNNGGRTVVSLDMASAIVFGTSTGSTETIADYLKESLPEVEGPFDVETIEGSVKDFFEKYDSLIVGTPTWNTGSDTERSGTGWDEIYYGEMQEMNMQGKKVAVFGLGDQSSYAENYADASGELHDVFEALGCVMMGYTSQEGYEHEDSKAIRGDKFCGLLCDEVNQEDLSAERAEAWVAQLKAEGFFEGGSAAPAAAASPVVEVVAEPVLEFLEENSALLDEAIESHGNVGFAPHYNQKTKSTMWVSRDGRSCYYTGGSVATKASSSSP